VREIIVDTETTGLDPSNGDRLVEIGAIEIVNQIATGSVYHVLINPEREVPEEAYRVHGHSTASLKGKPVFAAIAPEFLAFIGSDRLIIHNAEFDMRFINSELLATGRSPVPADRVIDTLALARRKHPGSPNSLDALCDRYRIDRSHRVKHGALLDAEILVEVYSELTGGRQKSLVLSNEPSANRRSAKAWTSKRSGRMEPLPPRVAEHERQAHADHVRASGEGVIWLHYLPVKEVGPYA
jgi:DNA polymerase-3 subunit epsilon